MEFSIFLFLTLTAILAYPQLVSSSTIRLNDTTNSLFAELLNATHAFNDISMHSCNYYCGGKTFLCYCDRNCEMFGDCCFDYWKYCDSPFSNIEIESALQNLTAQLNNTKLEFTSSVLIIDNVVYSFWDYKYHLVYLTYQKDLCSSDSSISSNDDALVAYYDKRRNIIYKTCNMAPNDDLIEMEYIRLCKPDFDKPASVDSDCLVVYKQPGNNIILHRKDYRILNWGTCDAQPGNTILNLLLQLINRNSSITVSDIDSQLCQLYLVPIILSAKINQTIQDEFVFRNIHCFKCWLSKNQLNFRRFRPSSKQMTLLELTREATRIEILIFDSYGYENEVVPYLSETLVDFAELYSRYSQQTDGLNLNDPQNTSISNPAFLRTIDLEFREITQHQSENYFMSQSIEYTNATNAIDAYNFTIHFQLYLVRSMFNESWTRLNFNQLVQEYFVIEFMKRYQLDRYQVNGSFTIKTKFHNYLTYMHDCVVDVFIPLRFSIKNLQVLNQLIVNLIKILKETYKLNFSLFQLESRKQMEWMSIINKIELLNSIYDNNNYQCDTSYENLTVSIGDLDFLIIKINNGASSYIHRLSSISGTKSFNIDLAAYVNKYRYSLTIDLLDNLTINLCYDKEIKELMFVEYDASKDYCGLDNNLYVYEDVLSVSRLSSQQWAIAYSNDNGSNGTNSSQITIESTFVARFSTHFYFLCLNKSDEQLNNAIMELNELVKSNEIEFIEPVISTAIVTEACFKLVVYVLVLIHLLI